MPVSIVHTASQELLSGMISMCNFFAGFSASKAGWRHCLKIQVSELSSPKETMGLEEREGMTFTRLLYAQALTW